MSLCLAATRCSIPRDILYLVASAFLLVTASCAQTDTAPLAVSDAAKQREAEAAADPFDWLEDIEGARALSWVKAENARTLATLSADPGYQERVSATLKILNATDRIPRVTYLGRDLTSFWQDPAHPRGLWRRTSLDRFRSDAPLWETLFDLDALAKAESANWVWKGAVCREPANDRCLLLLSDGGKDAVQVREFDVSARRLVGAGFNIPEGKQFAQWLDADTLILVRDWGLQGGEPTVAGSGYGYVVKTLRRGQALAEAAEIFRGEPTDIQVSPVVLRDGSGHVAVLIERELDFFDSEFYPVGSSGVAGKPLPLPAKVSLEGFIDGQLVITLQEPWVRGYATFPSGAVVSLDLEPAVRAPERVRPALLYAPNPRAAVNQVAVTKSRVIVTVYEDVQGKLATFMRKANGEWSRRELPVAPNSTLSVTAATPHGDDIWYSLESFLEPPVLHLANVTSGQHETVKSLPARFDASGMLTRQFVAVSRDGTQVPYFVTFPRNMRFDGAAPTLMTAYGGFGVLSLPQYAGAIGKLWLERGGVYVVANIRGGGEFGPAWHEAARAANRQRSYDDFAAVADDLIARKITSPRRLGAMGGSNAGLLMGVEMTQRPELWKALVIQVPLLDMERYDKLLGGVSWIAEYGDPADPVEGAFLRATSPYRRLHAGGRYPEPLFIGSTKDDRVHPAHGRKMAAKMQGLGLPFLFFENLDGGHGGAAANARDRAARIGLEFTYLSNKLMDP